MNANIKAMLKRTKALFLAYVLVLGSFSSVAPFLFAQKAGAWTQDITKLTSPEVAETTYGTPVNINVTATEDGLDINGMPIPGWIGYLDGKITATVPSQSGVILSSDCTSVTDWSTATETAEAKVNPSEGSLVLKDGELVPNKKGFVDVDFCFMPHTVSDVESPLKINFASNLPYTYWDRSGWFPIIRVKEMERKATTLMTVKPLQLEMSEPALVLDKIYDGNNIAKVTIGTLVGLIGIDDVDVEVSADPIFDTRDVGIDKPVELIYKLKGDDAYKYIAPESPSTLTGNITPRPITVAANPQTITYGDISPELTYTNDDLIEGDVLSGSLGRESNQNVGVYAITQGSLDNSNYEIKFIPADFEITKKVIIVTANNAKKIIGEADPVLAYSVEDGALVDGDKLEGNISRISGESVGQYEISVGTLNNPNYYISFIKGIFTIDAKPAPNVAPLVVTPWTQSAIIAMSDTTTYYDRVGVVDTGEPDSAGVAGNEKGAEVKSVVDKKKEIEKACVIFGIACYWWMIAIALFCVGIWWWFSSSKSVKEDGDKTSSSK